MGNYSIIRSNILGDEKCKKKKFLTEKDAKKRILEIKSIESSSSKKIPVSSYYCFRCDGFHLTSWDKKFKKDIANKKLKKLQSRINVEAEFWENKLIK